MIIFVNAKNEIKAVGNTVDSSLTPIVLDDRYNPFDGWTDAKICCYKVQVDGSGRVVMMTPYLDSRLLDHIDGLGKADEENQTDLADNRDGLIETFDLSVMNTKDVAECRDAIIELYGMITESGV